MKKIIIIIAAVVLIAVVGVILGVTFIKPNKKNGGVIGLFDMEQLKKVVPETEDAGYTYDGNPNIKAMYFTGADYNGTATKIFAYLGIPETSMPENGYPAVILLHGAGGRSFPDWVKLWNDRGYVAIAMAISPISTDSSGNDYENNPQGGPGSPFILNDLEDTNNSWTYITVANVIYCNNLLRSMQEVDANNIGVTGISMGSKPACIAASIDNRFKFAIPVYGDGLRHEDISSQSSIGSQFCLLEGQDLEIYKEYFDVAAYMTYCEVPFLWVCGVNDTAFSVDCNQRCADLSTAVKLFSWRAKLAHGQQPGDGSGIPEIFAFADYITSGNDDSLLRIDQGNATDGVITVTALNSVQIESATLYWSIYPGENWHDSGNVWTSEECTISDSRSQITVNVPENAVFAFIEITDENGFIISSRMFSF